MSLAGCILLLAGGAVGLWPSLDLAVSLQKLVVLAVASAIVLAAGKLRAARQLGLVRLLIVAGLLASFAGNVLVDRASWKLDALNRAVYAVFAHVPRFSELAFSQNGLAAVLILVIPFAVALASVPLPSRWERLGKGASPARGGGILFSAAAAALLLELLVTESRAALLSLGLAATLGGLFLHGRRRWLALLAPAVALALLASGVVSLPMSLSWLPTGGSSAERLAIWQSALLMIADMPLTGAGLGMFQRVYPLYILPAYHNIHPHAHNLFLQTYLDAGPLGCAGMLLLTISGAVATVRLVRHPPTDPRLRAIGVAAAVSWAAVFLHGQVDSYFAGDPRTYALMFLPLGLLLGVSPITWRPSRRWRLAGAMVAAGSLLLAIPWLLPAFWINVGSVQRLRAEDARPAFEHALALQPQSWLAERGLGLEAIAAVPLPSQWERRGEGAPNRRQTASESTAWLQAAIHNGAPGQLVHAELAQALEASGEPRAAIPEWRAAGGAAYLLRQAQAAASDVERERLLLTALQVDPGQSGARTTLAELYLAQARFPEARAMLERAPASSHARLLLGLMDYWIDGDLDRAIHDLPDTPEGAEALAAMRQQQSEGLFCRAQRSQASVYLGRLPRLTSKDQDCPPRRLAPAESMGRAYQALGLYAQAEAEFRLLPDPLAHYDLGLLNRDEGRLTAAIGQLRTAVEAIPNQEDFRLGLARLYVRADAVENAKQEYRAVLDLDPGNAEARRAYRLQPRQN